MSHLCHLVFKSQTYSSDEDGTEELHLTSMVCLSLSLNIESAWRNVQKKDHSGTRSAVSSVLAWCFEKAAVYVQIMIRATAKVRSSFISKVDLSQANVW